MTQDETVDYTRVPAGMQPFPAPESVFVADQQELAVHLNPLFSLDISTVNPEWSGVLHMLSPLEPYESLVGELTEWDGYHGDLLKTNWIGFKLEDGRYRLCGDPRYFFLHKDNADLPDPHPGARADLERHYAEQHQAYAKAAEVYKARGILVQPDSDLDEPVTFVEQLGGEAGLGNWVETIEFPKEIIEVDPDNGEYLVYPLSPAGNRFYHVASAHGWNYRSAGADLIVMLYEPIEGLVLFSFDYS